jgi:hypothetical protein
MRTCVALPLYYRIPKIYTVLRFPEVRVSDLVLENGFFPGHGF